MTSRDEYLTRAAGLRLLAVLSLAWWMTAIVFAVVESREPPLPPSTHSLLIDMVLANG
jgi:hypothetical protein